MTDIKQYLEETNTVLLTKEAFEYLKERASVFDKIRAEIDSYCSDNRDRNDGLYIAMKIIDKYRTESEEE